MMRPMRYAMLLLVPFCACADFPELEGTIGDAARQAPYPTLTEIPAAPAATGTEDAALRARIASLQARAARIRQIDITALQ